MAGWIIVIVMAVVIAVLLFLPVLGSGNGNRPSRERYKNLLEISIRKNAQKHLVFDRAWVERKEGLNILHLNGSPYEMGFQHGMLLKEEIKRGVMPYHAEALDNFYPFSRIKPMLRWFLKRYFDWTIYLPMLRHAPREFLQELKGLSDGSGVPFHVIFRGNMLSEFNMNTTYLVKRFTLNGLEIKGECTSFAAFGSQTVDGKLVMGRNTDYSGASLWDTTQTVFFYEPEEGFCFVNVGSAGLIKCNSCMNDKGICLGGHFMYSDDCRPAGTGFTAFELQIMKKAASIDEAYAIVKDQPRNGAFAFLLADGSRNEAAVIEASASQTGLRRAEGDCVWETNFMTIEEMKKVDLIQKYKIHKNPLSRYERMGSMIDRFTGKITPQVAAEFMGDHINPALEKNRPVGHVIATLANMTSVVFSPESFDFWVADGLAPVCNNIYRGFNFKAELSKESYKLEPAMLSPNSFVQTKDYLMLRRYYEAMVKANIPPTDPAEALGLLEDLIEDFPQEPVYHLVAAKLHLRRGDFSAAEDHLEAAGKAPLTPSERAQNRLLQGYILDVRGSRQEALECYQQIQEMGSVREDDVLSAINPLVLAYAARAVKTPATRKDINKLEVSFGLGSIMDG